MRRPETLSALIAVRLTNALGEMTIGPHRRIRSSFQGHRHTCALSELG